MKHKGVGDRRERICGKETAWIKKQFQAQTMKMLPNL